MLFADGRAILVPHPEVLAIAGDGVSLIVHLPDGVIEIIDLALVVSLRFKTPEVLGELTSAPAVP